MKKRAKKNVSLESDGGVGGQKRSSGRGKLNSTPPSKHTHFNYENRIQVLGLQKKEKKRKKKRKKRKEKEKKV